jgi:diaminopimelate epimerase
VKRYIEFWKMSGAGNDFIMLDNSDRSLDDILSPEFIRCLCMRGMSVGADGLIELRSGAEGLEMKYYNSDGHPASMCGNGGRCMARFAVERALAGGGRFGFRSDSGLHSALVTGEWRTRLWMTEPRIVFLDRPLGTAGGPLRCSLVDTGVPHLVAFVDDLENCSFETEAPLLRWHPETGGAGANVDFVSTSGGNRLMRTWERGVEGETLACGTGAVAAAIVLHELLGSGLPVELGVRSGLVLEVGRDDDGWWLEGEARIVYKGVLVAPCNTDGLTEGRP